MGVRGEFFNPNRPLKEFFTCKLSHFSSKIRIFGGVVGSKYKIRGYKEVFGRI